MVAPRAAATRSAWPGTRTPRRDPTRTTPSPTSTTPAPSATVAAWESTSTETASTNTGATPREIGYAKEISLMRYACTRTTTYTISSSVEASAYGQTEGSACHQTIAKGK